jgi:hypothetical protein
MLFPSADCISFQSWATILFGSTNQESSTVSRTRNFVERIVEDQRRSSPFTEDLSPSIPNQCLNWSPLSHLKGNYVEKTGVHLGTHWQNLKHW